MRAVQLIAFDANKSTLRLIRPLHPSRGPPGSTCSIFHQPACGRSGRQVSNWKELHLESNPPRTQPGLQRRPHDQCLYQRTLDVAVDSLPQRQRLPHRRYWGTRFSRRGGKHWSQNFPTCTAFLFALDLQQRWEYRRAGNRESQFGDSVGAGAAEAR